MSTTTSREVTRYLKRKLNNGQEIPVAGFGVYAISKRNTFDLVYEALVQGYRHIDNAVLYGNEKEAAQAVEQFVNDSNGKVKRSDIWYTTKIYDGDHGYERTRAGVEAIAGRVKEHIGYVDLVLVHSPLSNREKRLGTWKALQEYQGDPGNGTLQINSIGVSNYGIRHLEELFSWEGYKVKPVLNQLELHPWLPHIELRKYLEKHDIEAEAYSPLTQGYNLDDPELLALEKKYKVSKIEILLKWSYLQGFIVLAKTGKKERVKQNLEVLPETGVVQLDEGIVRALDKPGSKESFVWGGGSGAVDVPRPFRPLGLEG